MRMLSLETGLSASSLYARFPSREALLQRVARDVQRDLARRLLREAGPDPDGRRLLEVYVRWARANICLRHTARVRLPARAPTPASPEGRAVALVARVAGGRARAYVAWRVLEALLDAEAEGRLGDPAGHQAIWQTALTPWLVSPTPPPRSS